MTPQNYDRPIPHNNQTPVEKKLSLLHQTPVNFFSAAVWFFCSTVFTKFCVCECEVISGFYVIRKTYFTILY